MFKIIIYGFQIFKVWIVFNFSFFTLFSQNHFERLIQVWINEEDHLRVISMQKDGDMQACWKRWTGGLQQFENYIKEAGAEYMHSDHLGYILTCPSNLGSYESYSLATRWSSPYSLNISEIIFSDVLVLRDTLFSWSLTQFFTLENWVRYHGINIPYWNENPKWENFQIEIISENLGTGVRAGVHMKLEKLSVHPEFDNLLGKLRLQKRGTGESPKIWIDLFDNSKIRYLELSIPRNLRWLENDKFLRWCRHSLRRWYVRYFQRWSSWFLWTLIGPNGCWWC